MRPRTPNRQNLGFSLIEIMVAVAIMGIVAAAALPSVARFNEAGRARAAAKSVADAFHLARAQAIRTGNNQIVYFNNNADTGVDVAGNRIRRQAGEFIPIMVLDDGRPGTALQNCEIDPGESFIPFNAERGVTFGFTLPTAAQVPPNEVELAIPGTGSSFRMPNVGALTNRVLFRPDGVPVAFDDFCVSGRLGSGGGTIYLTTGNRDFAITLSPLGAVRVHTWNVGTGAWTT